MPYKDPQKRREADRLRHLKDPEKHRGWCKAWRLNNPEEYKAQRAAWRKRNPEKSRVMRRKQRQKPTFRIAENLRRRLLHALKGGKKSSNTLSLLAMSLHEFTIYVRGQFRPGMTWENYGPVWHLDHVIPCVRFDLTDPEQQKVCFRWDNYQPLFAEENLKKGATYAS